VQLGATIAISTALVARLEADLEAWTSGDKKPDRTEGRTESMGDLSRLIEGEASGAPATKSNPMVPILQAQRDRYKDKLAQV
jgi:hypothetical protein